MIQLPRVLICFGVCLLTSNAAKAPFIKKCNLEDTDCLLSSAQAALPYIADGLPNIGVPAADPLFIDEVKSEEAGVQLIFRDANVEGLKKCKVTNFYQKTKKLNFHIELECPIKNTGKYTAGGKLLFAAFEGNGDYEIKTDNLRIIVDLNLEVVNGDDGEKHWKIVQYTSSYETVDKFYFDLKNLFNGDQTRAQPILDILNYGWKEIIDTIGKPIINEIIAKVVSIVEKFFAAVPLSELQ